MRFMIEKIPYEGISWSIGSTSFRTKELNKKIELQISLLNNFWNIPCNKEKEWNGNEALQQEYYKYLWENDFIFGNAPRPAKDAREKTSGLCDIGLVDRKSRKLTDVGKELLEISKNKTFKSDNIIQIEADSFLYLKQLVKTSIDIGNTTVRPFVILARVLNKLGYLSYDEFIYFLPLISDEKSFEIVTDKISRFRKGSCDINQTIYEILRSHNSYKKALDLLLTTKNVDEDLIITVMMNRKSSQYSKPFFNFYKALYQVLINKDFSENSMEKLDNAISNCKNAKSKIRKLLYCTTKNIIKNGKDIFNKNILYTIIDEKSFREEFFKICHIAKTLNNLEDYGDLNLRYFTMSDCLITKDSKIVFDTLPKIFFLIANKALKELSFISCDLLYKSVELQDISSKFEINTNEFYSQIAKELGTNVYDRNTIQNILNKKRNDSFNKLLADKFSDNKLLLILDNFKNRKTANDKYDEEIKKLVSSNSDGPTSFEYIIAIIWYKVSEYQGDVLSYMNLSLDADLLPKTHAGGGEADIVWKYEKTKEYPSHDLLIEATLSDSTNQRRMEMEPVSRHLGNYLIANNEKKAYCVFVTNFLNINVISDFRSRKIIPYYGNNDEKISSMQIMPIETSLLETFLKNKIKYSSLYKIFEDHFNNPLEPKEWYEALRDKLLLVK